MTFTLTLTLFTPPASRDTARLAFSGGRHVCRNPASPRKREREVIDSLSLWERARVRVRA